MCKPFVPTACLILLLAAPCGIRPARAEDPGKDAPRVDRYGDPLPPGAIARLGTVRWRPPERQGSGQERISFSPDGKILAICDIGLSLWNVDTGKQVSWAPDGSLIHAAVFSADGKTLITLSHKPENWLYGERKVECLMERWEVGTGKRLQRRAFQMPYEDHAFQVFSADGKVFAHNEGTSKIHMWDTQSGKHLLQINQTIHGWCPISFSSDNRLLAVTDNEGNLCLFDRASGKRLHWIRRKEDRNHTGYYFITLSADGKLLAASTAYSLRVWDTATGELKHEFEECRGAAVFSADGKYLACGDEEGIRLWETTSFRELRRFEKPVKYIHALTMSPDGRLLASYNGSHNGVTVALWDVAAGKQRNHLPVHDDYVYSLMFTPGGTGLVSGSTDGSAIVWDLATARPRFRLPGHYPMAFAFAFSSDGKLLATGEGDDGPGKDNHECEIRLWNLTDGKLIRQFTGHLHSVGCLAFSPDGKRLASGGIDARFRVWDPATGKRLYQIRGRNGRRSVAFSPDGKLLALGNLEGGELGLWKADTGQKLADLGAQGRQRGYVTSVSFLRDGKTVISEEESGGRDAPPKLRCWDVASCREVRSPPLEEQYPDCCSPSPHYTLSADGALGAMEIGYGEESAIRLFDASTGKTLALLRGHTRMILSLAFSPDGKLLASGSRDTTILIWDVERARTQYYWSELLRGTADEKYVQALAAEPALAIAFLKDRLTRSAEIEARARRFLAQLDDDQFAVREKASQELKRQGHVVETILRDAAGQSQSPEVRRRLKVLLQGLKQPDKTEAALDPPHVRMAVALLEKIATPASRKTLEELARGPAEAVVTREVRSTLDRLKKPAKSR